MNTAVTVVASGWERYHPKVLWVASVLPIAFPGGGSGGVGGDCGGYGVVSDVHGVPSNVGGCGGVTGGTGGSASRGSICIAGGGMGGKRGGARLAHRDLVTHPRTPCFHGVPRSVVSRVLLLEVWEYVPGAIGGPERQQPMVSLVEPHSSSSLCLRRPRRGAGRPTPVGWLAALTASASRYQMLDTKNHPNGPKSVRLGGTA